MVKLTSSMPSPCASTTDAAGGRSRPKLWNSSHQVWGDYLNPGLRRISNLGPAAGWTTAASAPMWLPIGRTTSCATFVTGSGSPPAIPSASTLHRHMLDGRFFRNDPDVFSCSGDGKGRKFRNSTNSPPPSATPCSSSTTSWGTGLFLRRHISEYTPEQKQLLAEMFPSLEVKVTRFTNAGRSTPLNSKWKIRSIPPWSTWVPNLLPLDLPPGQVPSRLLICTGSLYWSPSRPPLPGPTK